MTVLVVTDSAATIPAELVSRLPIAIVPLEVIVDGVAHLDGEIPVAELLGHEDVSTSGPTPARFLEVYEGRAGDDGVLVLTVSAELGSGTITAARAAAVASSRSVRVVDTATAAGAEGLVVLAAARVAETGADLDAVEERGRFVADRVRLVASLPDLSRLAQSGHVPGAGAWAANLVGLRPVISLRHGSVRPLRPALSEEASVCHMMDAWRRTRPPGRARLHVAALHALVPDKAAHLLDLIRDEVKPATSFVGSFSTGMIVHSGSGLTGLAWWWEEV